MKKSLIFFEINNINSFKKLLIILKIIVVIFFCYNLSLSANLSAKLNDYETQQLQITGKVTDSKTGESMAGVNVIIKGSTLGAITDANGKYSIVVPGGNIALVFSFIGYASTEISATGKSVIDVALVPAEKALEEVVIVAYGTQKKTSLTSAVSSVKGNLLTATPTASLSGDLGGRLAGVIVKQTTGEVGYDAPSIYIRGIGSTGSSSPLLIVDDIPRNFTALDPNTIESITILKDAAAVAPYGVAGANGVILVTTKRGATGTPTVSYHAYMGFQNTTILPDVLTGYEFANMQNVASISEGLPARWTDAELQKFKDQSNPDAYPSTNVYKQFINKNIPMTEHTIEVMGGKDAVKYYASLGYLYQEGLWSTSYINRYNYSMNLDVKATKTTTLNFSLTGRSAKNMYPGYEGQYGGAAGMIQTMKYASSIAPLIFTNGKYGNVMGPAIFQSGYSKDLSSQLYTQVSFTQEFPFIKGLDFKATFAYDPHTDFVKTWRIPCTVWGVVDRYATPLTYASSILGITQPYLAEAVVNDSYNTYQARLEYSHSFMEKHNVSAMVNFEARAYNNANFSAQRLNYVLLIDELNMGSSNQSNISNAGTSGQSKQVGLVYRFTYDYDSKYLFETSGRYDGNYYFAPGKRFGFFPSISLGYRLSQEGFMKDISWLDNLKIRASYGEVGALAGAAFQYLSKYGIVNNTSVLGNAIQTGLTETLEPNPNITWEVAKKFDVGLEASVLKSLLSFELDYFHEHRSNMLVTPDVTVPQEYGISLSQVNAGVMTNQGIDFNVSSKYDVSKNFSITLNGNLTYAKNKLINIFETPATYDNPFRRLTGRPYGAQFGYVATGYFQLEDFDASGNLLPGIPTPPWGKVYPGDIRYKDLNNDGKITADDQTMIGNPMVPQIIYGFSCNVKYKGFSLDLLFQGADKVDMLKIADAAWLFADVGNWATKENLNYWTPTNRNALNPRPQSNLDLNNQQISSEWMKDASYLRLKTASLSYTIPSAISQKAGMRNVKVYIAGQNLLTFTKFTNFDPEISNNRGWTFPMMKVYSVGFDITF